jgi:hypothetical protein
MYFPLLHGEVHIIIGQNQGEFFGNVTHVNGVIRHGTYSSFDGWQRTGIREQVLVDKCQISEGRGQMSEDREQKTDFRT